MAYGEGERGEQLSETESRNPCQEEGSANHHVRQPGEEGLPDGQALWPLQAWLAGQALWPLQVWLAGQALWPLQAWLAGTCIAQAGSRFCGLPVLFKRPHGRRRQKMSAGCQGSGCHPERAGRNRAEFRTGEPAEQHVGNDEHKSGKDAERKHFQNGCQSPVPGAGQYKNGDNHHRDQNAGCAEVEHSFHRCLLRHPRDRSAVLTQLRFQIHHHAVHGGSRSGEWDRGAVGYERDRAGCNRRKAQADEKRRGDCGRCAVSGGSLDESAEQIPDDQRLNPPVRTDPLKDTGDDGHQAGFPERIEQEDGPADDQQKIKGLQPAVQACGSDAGKVHLP